MTPERWRAVDAVLQGALALQPARRDAYVAEACAGDEALRREVASLLAAHDGAADFLERPAVAALSRAPLGERLAAALRGRYAVEREIGRGGMATVHLARDLRHERPVAIKVLREELAAAVGAERFLKEVRVLASLQHPHVLPLFDSGEADGVLWYAMPYVEGETLRARLEREGPLPVDEAVRLAREVADALDHAHARGVVHRDVKPENVLLQGGPRGARALVADFGVALALEHAGGERLTRTGLALGTPQYMAPEQATGERALDARVDVYALGAVLYEMLGGAPPFADASRQAVMRRVLYEPPPPLAARRPDLPAFVDAAVRCALAKHPDDRFPSAAALAAALAVPLDGPSRAERGNADAGSAASGACDAGPRGRVVSARAALYAALLTLGVGAAAGAALSRWSPAEWWGARAPDDAQPAWAAASAPAVVTDPRFADAAAGDGLALVVVDRAGRSVQEIAATRPWTPRFSPDGRRVAYGAFGAGRGSSDLWVTDLGAGTTRRLTDGAADANDPQWSPDGQAIAYSASASGGKDVMAQGVADRGGSPLARRDGTQFPSDWARDGRALLVTEEGGENGHDVLVQPADGTPAWPYAATRANESAARVSPDGRWVAYTSDESGRAEVYLDSYARPGRRVVVSTGGGVHPVWRGDGRELYYWRDGALVAAQLGAANGDAPPAVGPMRVLFRAPYHVGVNTMYDASPDGERFVLVRQR
jgi:serine/threonine-protein kinase